MPSEMMDQRQLSSFFSEEIHLPAQRQVGFWKSESVPDHQGEVSLMSAGQPVASSPLQTHSLLWSDSVSSEPPRACSFKEQKSKHIIPWRAADQDMAFQSNLSMEPISLFMEDKKVNLNGLHHENGLFSSSLSAIFERKLKLSPNAILFGQSIDAVHSNFEKDEPFESFEELEAQTIGNLLPDDEDLLSGVVEGLEYPRHPIVGDDIEDDLFCSVGGLELEEDDSLTCYKTSEFIGGELINGHDGGLSGPIAGEHPFGEHPSRTLFVRNVNSNVEDAELRALFEQYGDIRTMYTACKHHGFVMISYYDIRAAQNAMSSLQNKPLSRRKLDIHFSIPKDNPSEEDINQGTLLVFNLDSSISNDDLQQVFGVYGEIKVIRETPHGQHHKLIEFYDVRAAETTLRALNGSEIRGKRISIQPSNSGGARQCLMPQFSPDLKQGDFGGCRLGSPSNSLSISSGSIPAKTNTSNSLKNGAIQGLQAIVGGPFGPLLEPDRNRISPSVPHVLSSPVGIAAVGNQSDTSGPADVSHSVAQVNFGVQGIPSFHPHSVPEFNCHNISGTPYNSSSTMSSMAIHLASRPSNGTDNRHLSGVGSGSLNSHSFEHNEAFGVSPNGSASLHRHQFAWNNANSYQNHPSAASVWSGTTPYMDSISTRLQPHMHGLSRLPSHLLSSVLPLHHHVGPAPAVDPSLWERRHAYAGNSIEPSAFHPGSLGNIGFSVGSPLHPLELAHSMFAHAGGNCIDHPMSPVHIGIPSPQQRLHMFHGRGPIMPMPVAYDTPSDRFRSRRNDNSANQADIKKQYELDVDRIIRREDSRTTLMIKNIPNKYTSKMLLATIDENHRGTYDFIYLPIDFKNKCNVGYAFINLTDPQHIIPFFKTFNGKKWEKFNSEKVASLAYARIQGKAALVAHFQNSSLMNEDKRCRPILFHSDGPNAGDQEPFPMGVNVRSRAGRSRTNGYENHEGSPSTSPTREEQFKTLVPLRMPSEAIFTGH